jgi:ATP-dependent Zn protease
MSEEDLDRDIYETKPTPTFCQSVALYGIQKSLAVILAEQPKRFGIVLVAPQGKGVEVYEGAASCLLMQLALTRKSSSHKYHAARVGSDTDKAIKYLEKEDHVLLIASSFDQVGERMRLRMDAVANIAAPTPSDFKLAYKEHFAVKLSEKDAKFLLKQSWDRLSLAFAPGRPHEQALARLREVPVGSVATVVRSVPKDALRLDDLHGYGDAKEWGIQLVKDFQAFRNGEISWNDVDRGVVLFGPPGVGKTIFARALANSCGAKLVHGSAGMWQSEGHMGDMLKAMRKAFDQAREGAPAILFVDEVDSFGDRDKTTSDNADYIREVINTFLECLDGVQGRDGVVVIGATNRVDKIDPAILRSGRMERSIEISLPDIFARRAILRHHLATAVIVESPRFDDETDGWSGADIEMLARQVRRLARTEGTEVTRDLVERCLPKRIALDKETIWRIAIHEAGHVVVGLKLGLGEFRGVSMKKTISAGVFTTKAGSASFDRPALFLKTRENFLDCIALFVGGIAAEQLLLGGFSDGASGEEQADLVKATNMATALVATMGMDQHFVSEVASDPADLSKLRAQNPVIWKRTDVLIKAQFARCLALLDDHRSNLSAIVVALVEKGALMPADVEKAMTNRIRAGKGRRN